jgi:hypothetical protein
MSDTRAPEYKNADRRTAREAGSASQAVVPTQRARQGVTGHNVRYVLGFGIAGIVVAFLIVYLVYFG